MTLDFITEMYIPLVMVLCLVVGYIAKKWIQDVDNKWIPTIVTVVGVIAALVIQGVSVEIGIAGAVTGLASTGLHQLFTRLMDLVGISLRTVQEYEQGNRDINKCQAIKVYNICKVLDCDIKDILEFDS